MVTAKMRKEISVYYTTQLATDKSSKDMWRTPKKNTTETIKSTNLTELEAPDNEVHRDRRDTH